MTRFDFCSKRCQNKTKTYSKYSKPWRQRHFRCYSQSKAVLWLWGISGTCNATVATALAILFWRSFTVLVTTKDERRQVVRMDREEWPDGKLNLSAPAPTPKRMSCFLLCEGRSRRNNNLRMPTTSTSMHMPRFKKKYHSNWLSFCIFFRNNLLIEYVLLVLHIPNSTLK